MDKEQALDKHSNMYEPGAVLFREGDAGSKLWVINEGQIQLSKRVCSEEIVLETLEPGEFCGEISLVTQCPQPVTATVVKTARLLIVEASQFESMLRSNGELAMRMLRKLAGRLNEAQFRLTALQLRNTLGRVMLQLRREIDISSDNHASLPVDLAQSLGLDPTELEDCLDKLVVKKLIELDDNIFSITNSDEYARYLDYLELRDRYEFFDKN